MQSATLFGAITALPPVEGLLVGHPAFDTESSAANPKGESFSGHLSLDAVPGPTDAHVQAWPISIAVPFAGLNPVGLVGTDGLMPDFAATEIASAPVAGSDDLLPPTRLDPQHVPVPAEPMQPDQATPDLGAIRLVAGRGRETADPNPAPKPWVALEKVVESVTEPMAISEGQGLNSDEQRQTSDQAKAERSDASFAAGLLHDSCVAADPNPQPVTDLFAPTKVATDKNMEAPPIPASADDAKPRTRSSGSIPATKLSPMPETLPESALAQPIRVAPENPDVDAPEIARFRPGPEHGLLVQTDAGPAIADRHEVEPEVPSSREMPEATASAFEPLKGPLVPFDLPVLHHDVGMGTVETKLAGPDPLAEQHHANRIAVPGALPVRPGPGFPASHLAFLATVSSAAPPDEAQEAAPDLPLAMPDYSLTFGSDGWQFRADTVRVLVANLAQVIVQAAPQLVQGRDGATTLTLSPDELGQVRLSFQPDPSAPDQMAVMLTFDRPETMELFRRNADQLADALRQAGYAGVQLGFGSTTGEGTQNHTDQKSGGGPEAASPMPLPQNDTHPLAGLATGLVALDLRL